MELPIGKVNTWVRRHPGYEAPGHLGRGSAGHSWASWLLGLVSLGLLGWADWLGDRAWAHGTHNKVYCFCRGGRSSPVGKKRSKLDRQIIGNSRPSMLLHFQRKFCNFMETTLDAIGSFELILRFRGSYKRLVVE